MNDTTTNSIIIGVASSLIASILFWILLPIFKKLGIVAINFVAQRNKAFEDSLYKRASKRMISHNKDLGIMMTIILTFSILIWGAISEDLAFNSDYLNKSIEEIFFLLFAFISMSIFLFRWLIRDKIIDLIRDFENKLAVLSPSVPDKIIKEFKRDWILMKDYSDYKKLRNEIDQAFDNSTATNTI